MSSEAEISREKGVGLDVLFLGGVTLAGFMANLMFFFSLPFSSAPLWLALAVVTAAAGAFSWRRAAAFAALCVGFLFLTAQIETYDGPDAMSCYVPMQRLLANGWNPMAQTTADALRELTDGRQAAFQHILSLPRFSAVIGALSARTVGSYTGDLFLGLAMMVALFFRSLRFGSWFFRSRAAAFSLALVVTACSKVTSFLSGQVDYTIYAATVIAVLAAAQWLESRWTEDLVCLSLALCIGFSTKATGVLYGLVILIVLAVAACRRCAFWVAVLAIATVTLVLCWSPYAVGILANGTPFPRSDLTSDFVGNVDALDMGRLARVVYAWLSPELACRGCSLLNGGRPFHPEFSVVGGVGGIGRWFCCLLAFSGILMCLTRRRLPTVCCIVLFVSANLLPLKYIGYARYQFQVWAIPFIALLNFACNPAGAVGRMPGFVLVRRLAFVFCVGLGVLTVARTAAFARRKVALESFRESVVATLPDRACRLAVDAPCEYALADRLRAKGLTVGRDEKLTPLFYELNYFVPYVEPKDLERIHALYARYPVCDSLTSLLKYNWR